MQEIKKNSESIRVSVSAEELNLIRHLLVNGESSQIGDNLHEDICRILKEYGHK